jgi:hypothetical protein
LTPGKGRYFSLPHSVQISSRAHLVFYPAGARVVSPGVKRPGREANHLPPSSAEVKNAWSYTSTTQYVFMAWCLIMNRDNVYLTYKSDNWFRKFGSNLKLTFLHKFPQNTEFYRRHQSKLIISVMPVENSTATFGNSNL